MKLRHLPFLLILGVAVFFMSKGDLPGFYISTAVFFIYLLFYRLVIIGSSGSDDDTMEN
jgi:hypothetical protein